jgi:hypothetical protein
VIDYNATYHELINFAENYAMEPDEMQRRVLAKKLNIKIKEHYQYKKEFSETILPQKIRIMELATVICKDEFGKRNHAKIQSIYDKIVSAILETQAKE